MRSEARFGNRWPRPVTAALAAAVIATVSACAARRPPAPVTDVSVDEQNARLAGSVRPAEVLQEDLHPPRYFDEILPDYPPAAVEDAVERVRVAVTMVVGRNGRPRALEAEVLDDHPKAPLFETAALEAAARWRFSPAWRLARTGDPDPIVVVDYRTKLVFLFRRTEGIGGASVESFDQP